MPSSFDAQALFPADYFAARAAFLEAAHAAGARTESHAIQARGPDGETLTIDSAYLGPPSPSALLILTSGVHGVEGYVGCAWQRMFLEHFRHVVTPEQGVLLVHAINPFGFAWGRRVNENNVDLNRNALERFPDPTNADYGRVHGWLCRHGANDWPGRFELGAVGWRLRLGAPALRQAVAGGQYEFADGLFYGGGESQESVYVLQRLLAAPRYVSTRNVVHLDLHGGLGRWGELRLFAEHPPQSPEMESWVAVFGTARVTSGQTTDNGGYAASGVVVDLTKRVFPGRPVACAVLEAGTLSPLAMLRALRVENALYYRGAPSGRRRPSGHLIRAFCPENSDWRSRVMREGADILSRLGEMLAHRHA